MRTATNPADVPPMVRKYVHHAITQLLRPDELDGWSFRWKDGDTGDRDLCVDLVAAGEPYMGFLYSEKNSQDPIEDALDIFTDGLEDFISESRFAWGQRRELSNRPWRAAN